MQASAAFVKNFGEPMGAWRPRAKNLTAHFGNSLRVLISVRGKNWYIYPALNAEVVKLANTLRSERSDRKVLRVQIPPSALAFGG